MNLGEKVSLAHFNSFAVPICADELYVLDSINRLEEILTLLAERDKRLILGGGSNVLFRDNFHGLVVLNQLKGIDVIEDNSDSVLLEVAAGENWHRFVRWCIKRDYYGIENLSLIPGTVGASPIQNIGAYGVEVEKYIDSLTAIDLHTGKAIKIEKQACQFSYRDSIFKHELDRYLIIAVRFKLSKVFSPVLEYAGIKEKLLQSDSNLSTVTAYQISEAICALRRVKLPDPSTIGNAGSFFKNPVVSIDKYTHLKAHHPSIPMYRTSEGDVKIPAAWMVEQCGFKGYRLGDAGVYQQHALVLVNYGGASGKQIWDIARTIQKAVKNMYGINLVPEPRIL